MISIVVPTLNRPQSLVKLVGSLQSQIVTTPMEILIVYNTKEDAAHCPVSPSPQLKILVAPQTGVNWARNTGVRAALGSVVLFIDDDCLIISPHFVQKHYDLHQQNPQLAALGGPYVLASQSSFWDRVYQINNELWIEANLIPHERSHALLGGNASYKKNVFVPGYFFTEEITYGGSETPLNTLLALKYGPLGFYKDLTLEHRTSMGLYSLLRKASRQGRGAALQTQMYAHPLKKISALTHIQPTSLRWALECYALFFMTSYKATLFQRPTLLLFFREILEHFDKRVLQRALRRLQHALWWIQQALSPVNGFLTSLQEIPPGWNKNLSLPIKIKLRLFLISKKMGWLVLKTVGLR